MAYNKFKTPQRTGGPAYLLAVEYHKGLQHCWRTDLRLPPARRARLPVRAYRPIGPTSLITGKSPPSVMSISFFGDGAQVARVVASAFAKRQRTASLYLVSQSVCPSHPASVVSRQGGAGVRGCQFDLCRAAIFV
jgi:hypothetical protein